MNDYPHVTKVLGVLRKEALEFWFKFHDAKFCDAESRRGLEVGKVIHLAIQNHIEKNDVKFDTEYPEEVTNCLKSFFQFKKDHPELTLRKAEVDVVSEKHKFCGRLDCLAKEKNEIILFDWKNGKCGVGKKNEKEIPPVYPEHEYQVAAYVAAYNEQTRSNIRQARVLVLAKDKVAYNLMPIFETALQERFEQVFLPALKIYNYQQKEKNNGKLEY